MTQMIRDKRLKLFVVMATIVVQAINTQAESEAERPNGRY